MRKLSPEHIKMLRKTGRWRESDQTAVKAIETEKLKDRKKRIRHYLDQRVKSGTCRASHVSTLAKLGKVHANEIKGEPVEPK